MIRRNGVLHFVRMVGLVQAIVFGLLSHDALAAVKKAVMEVDLKNPGAKIASISFVIVQTGVDPKTGVPPAFPTGFKEANIDVSSPSGTKDLFPLGVGALVTEEITAINGIRITLTPIRVFSPP